MRCLLFAHLTGLDCNVLQIHVCCFKADRTTDNTLRRVVRYLYLDFIEFSLTSKNIWHIRVTCFFYDEPSKKQMMEVILERYIK